MGEVHRSDTVTGPAATQSGPIRITASSNRPPAVLWRLRDRLDIEFVRIGSAGAKAMAVVRGGAEVGRPFARAAALRPASRPDAADST